MIDDAITELEPLVGVRAGAGPPAGRRPTTTAGTARPPLRPGHHASVGCSRGR
jgi:hypothetical protein